MGFFCLGNLVVALSKKIKLSFSGLRNILDDLGELVSVTALIVWLLIAAMPMAVLAGSARMELSMAPDVVAEADYWPGAADMPAILILHGFLQTREFPTIRRLAESLADKGFSVLTPSLTLGLNRRRQSLACEAIHTHSLQQDVAELTAWTMWLARRAGKAPVVIGHSTAGVLLAAMLDAHRARIEQAVLVSMTAFGQVASADRVDILRQRAVESVAQGIDQIEIYSLGYCRDYATTATALLSYLEWDRDRLGQALIAASVPVTVIFGEKDERADRAWLDFLAVGGVEIRAVAGADHFFDLAHEFGLLHEVIKVIRETDHG
jgi:pimeloyl-ACP methyl ester carboxylesterase